MEVIKLAAIDKINGVSTQQYAINVAGAQSQQAAADEASSDSVQKSAPEIQSLPLIVFNMDIFCISLATFLSL